LSAYSDALTKSVFAQSDMIVGLFTELLSYGGIQGAGRQTAAVLAGIARKRGIPYRFLSLNDPKTEHHSCCGKLTFVFRGFHRDHLRFTQSVIQLVRERPSLVLAAHPNLAPPAAILKACVKDLRCIVMTHGIEVWTPLSWLRRMGLRRADRVLAPSNDTARKVHSVQGVSELRICLLPWCLDPEFLALCGNPNSFIAPSEYPEGRIILAVGRWSSRERYKGVDKLIGVLPYLLRELPDLYLVAVGDGDDRPRLEQIALEKGVAQRVRFLESPSMRELVACYARCDVFALPSTCEGFGLVFLEAMALGKPAIGCGVGGPTDLIEDGCTGILVPPNDESQLSAALRGLLTDEKLCREMGLLARDRVRTRYCFDSFQQGLERILYP
jgi:phosphatidyl-myo-inositol dimannoside synthase